MKPPKSHELGGKYGQGIIVSNFEPEQIFTVTVEITAHHRGYWYFKICPNPKTNRQSCFDKYPVELATGGTNFYPSKGGVYKVKYRLPKGLVCDHCVLQWRYVAGNNWGFCGNGTSGLGCGNQETFGACSDISISENSIDTDARPVKFATASNDISEGKISLLISYLHVKLPSIYLTNFIISTIIAQSKWCKYAACDNSRIKFIPLQPQYNTVMNIVFDCTIIIEKIRLCDANSLLFILNYKTSLTATNYLPDR